MFTVVIGYLRNCQIRVIKLIRGLNVLQFFLHNIYEIFHDISLVGSPHVFQHYSLCAPSPHYMNTIKSCTRLNRSRTRLKCSSTCTVFSSPIQIIVKFYAMSAPVFVHKSALVSFVSGMLCAVLAIITVLTRYLTRTSVFFDEFSSAHFFI